MGYVFIIFFVLSFFIVTFALIHLLAVLPGIPFLTWILGATLCCVGAYKNGKEKGNINKSHHAIRITIAVLLTLGLALV